MSVDKIEYKRTRPAAAHDCNVCSTCQRCIKSNSGNHCGACQFLFFEKLYRDFSSGNKVADEIIKNPIYRPNKYGKDGGKVSHYEWIPWESLSNINKIGEGGFGTIYRATLIDGLINKLSLKHHGSMEYKRWSVGKEVAIKFIKTSLKKNEEVFKELNIQRFMFTKIDQMFISKIKGLTQNAETLEYGIVMWFAQHGDMRKYLSTNFISTSWKDKLRIASDLAWGLNLIHSSGMVHRDLHSGNILQLRTDMVNIGDFGLCQPTNNEATTTEEKKIYGVIPYIPPEVLRGEKFTTAGDIYSYGMILWELATGKPPFYDRSHDQILIMNILNGVRPEIISPLIPSCYAKLIEKCWDANAENRPKAFEVWSELDKLDSQKSEFRKSEKYIKQTVESDDGTTKLLGKFLKYNKFFKKNIKHDETKLSTKYSGVIIHPGAVYISRLLTAQMVDFSTGLFI
ncbi:hypothetical protein G9A89_023462 [Geosiphon pyriformis]|nr:hypothetical protein G9A89_023462 [Geosiphon pyriformis]